MDGLLLKLWHLVVTPDPTLWAGFIGLGGAIVAGWLSGSISGKLAVAAALRGAKQAHADNLERERLAKEAQVIAFVQAIKAEIEGLWVLMRTQIAPAVKEIGVGKPLRAVFVVSDDYFVVYRANANLLGSVDSQSARRSIVKVYIAAQSFLDTIRMSNRLNEQMNAQESSRFEAMLHGNVPTQIPEIVSSKKLESFSVGVVSAWQEFEGKRNDFVQETNAWLQAHGGKPEPETQFIGT